MEKFWAKYKWWIIAAVVLVVGIVIYFVFFNKEKKSTGSGAGTDGNGNPIPKPFYYDDKVLELLKEYKQNKNLDAFDDTSGGTASHVLPGDYWWGAFCHKLKEGFDKDVCGNATDEGYWDRLNGDTVLAWFKGMNVNPIRAKTGTPENLKTLELVKEPVIVEAIKKYYETAWVNGERTYWANMETGKYYNVFA